jgi:phytoene dehydrogenase-like protein
VHLTGDSLAALATAVDECRAGSLPAAPAVVSWNDATIDPSRAPEGKDLKKFVVLGVPYEISGDAIPHGAPLSYQSGPLRPIPELGQYRSPVSNVYLCGSGSHPGAGVSMAGGRNAAQVICSDLGLDFDPAIRGW